MTLQTIDPQNLICMEDDQNRFPYRVQLAYKDDCPPNIFGKIYRDSARLWLHKDLAEVVKQASALCHDRSGARFILYDGLRTIEAQEAMMRAPLVQENPQWLEEPNRLLSPSGTGAHPRGMAIDIGLEDENGDLIDMGTVFDHLAEDSGPDHNPAHRAYTNLTDRVRKNRYILNAAMMDAARNAGYPLHLLESEWWDFRAPQDMYERYAPLSDQDLLQHQRMTPAAAPNSDRALTAPEPA